MVIIVKREGAGRIRGAWEEEPAGAGIAVFHHQDFSRASSDRDLIITIAFIIGQVHVNVACIWPFPGYFYGWYQVKRPAHIPLHFQIFLDGDEQSTKIIA